MPLSAVVSLRRCWDSVFPFVLSLQQFHVLAPPSLRRVLSSEFPGFAVLRGAPTPCRSSQLTRSARRWRGGTTLVRLSLSAESDASPSEPGLLTGFPNR